MAKYIVTLLDTSNYVEVNGFTIMTDKEVEEFEGLANSINWEFTYEIGNDGIELEYTSGEDLLSRLDFKEITNSEHETLKKIFDGEFGVFINESYLSKLIDEVEEQNNNEEEFDFE